MTDDPWKKKIKELEAKGLLFKGPAVPYVPINIKNTFEYKGIYLLKREGKFWIQFQGGGHGGPDIIKEITEAEYFGGRNGSVDIDVLQDRYKEQAYDAHGGAIIAQRWKQKGIYEESDE